MPFRTKTTFEFEGGQKGWTESLYLEPLTGTFSEAVSISNAICVSRAALLGSQCAIKAYRVQIVQDAAGAKVTRRGDNFQRSPFIGNAKPAAQPDVCLECDFLDATLTRHKTMFMRGIWDEIESDYGAYEPTPAWTSAFDTWRSGVVASGFGWIGRTPSAKVNITTYEQTDEGYVLITTEGTPFTGLPVGVPIQVNIQGLVSQGGLSSLNGTITVKPNSNNTCTTNKQHAVLPYISGGRLNTLTYSFVKAAGVAPEKIGTHETGAPLLESRGRQRARSAV